MKLINIEKEFFINERLAKKYNAIVRFLEKNKNVVYESGCINRLIINVEYEKGKNNFILSYMLHIAHISDFTYLINKIHY